MAVVEAVEAKFCGEFEYRHSILRAWFAGLDGPGCISNPASELMMKKGIGKLIVYIFVIVITVFGLMFANNLLDRENILDRILHWPDLRVYTLDGKQVSTADIRGENPRVLYYFNSECIFCQETFRDLPNHPELKDEASLIFVSGEDPGIIRDFISSMELENMPEIYFYVDSDQQVKKHFAIRGVPAIYIYSQQGELIELFRGATSLTTIRSRLKEEISSN